MECPVCQSCGMPLYNPEIYGTDKEGKVIEDYCLYCYKDGDFTSDVTMDEMIELCVKYMKNTLREEAVSQMKLHFPKLKRWVQKEETQAGYYKSINKVLDYIHSHLDKIPDLETLSDIANISPFHFHRIFKGVIGETLGDYVQRIRLEYVAGRLKSNSDTLETLALKTGYNSPQALSKAFKKYFGIPPSTYKSDPHRLQNKGSAALNPRICKIASKNVLYLKTEEELTSANYDQSWKELYVYSILKGIYTDTSESVSISFDENLPGKIRSHRFYVCITTTKETESNGKFIFTNVDGGPYAIFTHKGSYNGLHDLYKNIWFRWLPSSKYRVRKGAFMEKYLNNPDTVKEEDILTEIYVPVALK